VFCLLIAKIKKKTCNLQKYDAMDLCWLKLPIDMTWQLGEPMAMGA